MDRNAMQYFFDDYHWFERRTFECNRQLNLIDLFKFRETKYFKDWSTTPEGQQDLSTDKKRLAGYGTNLDSTNLSDEDFCKGVLY